jgi:hypothetical protein
MASLDKPPECGSGASQASTEKKSSWASRASLWSQVTLITPTDVLRENSAHPIFSIQRVCASFCNHISFAIGPFLSSFEKLRPLSHSDNFLSF